MVFNSLHNEALQYLVDLCQSVSGVASRQHLRSASQSLLVVPRHCLDSHGWRAFSVAGPATWNWSPDILRDLAIYSRTVVRQLSYVRRSYAIYTTPFAIHETWRTSDRRKYECKSATYLHMSYDRHHWQFY